MDALLRTILSSSWAIDEAYAISVNEMMQRLFSGESVNLESLIAPKSQSEIITNRLTGTNIAVVKIHDVMMREDWCGTMGTESLNNLLKSYATNSAIGGVIMDFDTPGGQAAYTENVAQTIANFPKPIVGYVSSSCASAGYWLASQCDSIFTSVKSDRVGSIGTMISYYKENPESEEKPRYVQVNVYASKSTDKNRATDEMLQGNHERIISEVLDPTNEVFLENVQQGRASIQSQALTGKMYYSAEAIRLGLIDGIKSFEEVVDYISEEIQNAQNQNTMGIFSKNKKPQQMKNQVYSDILGRDVMDGEVLSVEDLAKVQSHIEGLQNAAPRTPAPAAEEAPVTQSLEDVVAAALSPISSQLEQLTSRLAKLEGPGATETVVAPVTGGNGETVAPWEDPNRSYNKALIG